MKLRVRTWPTSSSYRVEVQQGLLANVGEILLNQRPTNRAFILTNTTVRSLWYNKLQKSLNRAGITCCPIVIGDGERYKNIATYNRIITQLIEKHADRHAVLLTLGGGVIGDLGGYVAATYKRGIDLVHIPTTLVAQIDSSIGGKTALDHRRAKNMIGCFYNPRLVVTDPDILSTLPEKEFRNGLFEAIKTALVSGGKLYEFMPGNLDKIQAGEKRTIGQLVQRCAREKIKIVAEDPFDNGRRAILNFGHTFGHVLEATGAYRGIRHGEAVGWGMLLALRLSIELSLAKGARLEKPFEIIKDLLPKTNKIKKNSKQFWPTMLLDKKAINGRVNFVLLKSIGRPIIHTVSRRMFEKALSTL